MLRNEKIAQSKNPNLTALEEGLRKAVLSENKAKTAFERLVEHGYETNHLIIHLTLWARSPEVLFSQSDRAELPGRDGKKRLQRFSLKLHVIADELAGENLCKELLEPKFLERNQIVAQNGGLEMARRLRLLPQALRLYSRLLTRSLLIKSRFARDDKTLNEHRAEFTRIFVDHVKKTTGKDRIDSVVILFNLASRHFGLREHFEKRALAAQVKRLRNKTRVQMGRTNDRPTIR